MAIRLAGTAITLGLQLVLVRWLGLRPFGEYMYALSWVGLLALVAPLGLDAVAPGFLSDYRAEGALSGAVAYLSRALLLVSGASLLLSMALVLVVESLAHRIAASLAHLFVAAAVLLPILSLLLLASGVLRGFGRTTLSLLPQWLLRPGLLALALALGAAVVGRPPCPTTVMLADAAVSSILLAALVVTAFRPRFQPPSERKRPPVRKWLAAGLPVLALVLARELLNRLDLLVLGGLQGTVAAGIYSVALRMSLFVTFGPMTISQLVAPVFAELADRRRTDELQRLVTRAGRSALLVSLAVAAFVALVGPLILPLFGEELAAAGGPLRVLLVARILGVGIGTTGVLLTLTGNASLATGITAAAALLDLLLNLLMIPRYGMLGAAIGTTLANGLCLGGLAIAVRRRTGLRSLSWVRIG